MNKVLSSLKSAVAAAGCATIVFCTPAVAASFSISGGQDTVLGNNFDPTNNGSVDMMGLQPGATVSAFFLGNLPGGLMLSGPTSLLFTYVGTEAGFTNQAETSFTYGGSPTFQNHGSGSDTGGETSAGFQSAAGLVAFLYATLGYGPGDAPYPAVAANGGPIDGRTSIAFFIPALQSNVAFALFEDIFIGGDGDYDDMVVKITAVPVPAALPLFGGGLGMLGWLARRKRRPQVAAI